MAGYLTRRILSMIPLLLGVATVTFLLMHAVPGGPFETNERPLPPSTLAALESKYGLDQPLWEQYLTFLGNLVQFDLGYSFSQNRPVNDVMGDRWPATVQLGLCSFAFAVFVGVTLGVISAVKQNRWQDYFAVVFATIGVAIPNFVMAVFLVIIFSLWLPWFDVIGWEFGNYKKMVLPTVTLGLLPAAYIARVSRASMLEALRQDYVRTARAKGLIEFQVVLRHVIKNAAIPVLTVIGPILAGLVTGSFIIERTFSIPGIGTLFVDSVLRRDYGIIMATVLLFAFAIAMLNLIVDIAYGIVDPRIRY